VVYTPKTGADLAVAIGEQGTSATYGSAMSGITLGLGIRP